MPSERFLAEHFQVARGTVRQEVNRLVADGVLYRQHGTATFTAERQAAHIDMLTSFTEDMQARGVVPKTKVLPNASVKKRMTIVAQPYLVRCGASRTAVAKAAICRRSVSAHSTRTRW